LLYFNPKHAQKCASLITNHFAENKPDTIQIATTEIVMSCKTQT